jgi:hypothetical protein
MTPALNFKSLLGGEVKTYNWTWQNQPYGITYEVRGDGLPLLLLPAFSTVSSRAEMQGFAEYFSPNFQVFPMFRCSIIPARWGCMRNMLPP